MFCDFSLHSLVNLSPPFILLIIEYVFLKKSKMLSFNQRTIYDFNFSSEIRKFCAFLKCHHVENEMVTICNKHKMSMLLKRMHIWYVMDIGHNFSKLYLQYIWMKKKKNIFIQVQHLPFRMESLSKTPIFHLAIRITI